MGEGRSVETGSTMRTAAEQRADECAAKVGNKHLSELDSIPVEKNEVLRFLLGKTSTIGSDDSCSVTSTSSSSNSSNLIVCDGMSDGAATPSSVCEGEHPKKVAKQEEEQQDEWCKTPELDPISESDSEDDAQRMVSPMGIDCLSQVRAEISSNGKRPGQQEDEDTSFQAEKTGLRHRKPVSTAHQGKLSPAPQTKLQQQHTAAAQRDACFIGTVLFVLVSYCLAICYRSFNPVTYSMPNIDALFTPWDISNVSIHFVSPEMDDFSYISGNPIQIEWHIQHFPVEALRVHGPETFQYTVSLDGRLLHFEIDYWRIEPNQVDTVSITKTIRHRLRPRDILASSTSTGQGTIEHHELQVEVVFPIPGSDGVLHTLTRSTSFTIQDAPSVVPLAKIISPADGAVIITQPSASSTVRSSSILLEFQVANVQKIELFLDDKWRIHVKHGSDGNFLLRGLGVGHHTVELQGFDDKDDVVASHLIRIEVREKEEEEEDGTRSK